LPVTLDQSDLLRATPIFNFPFRQKRFVATRKLLRIRQPDWPPLKGITINEHTLFMLRHPQAEVICVTGIEAAISAFEHIHPKHVLEILVWLKNGSTRSP
jgi:hypothetical protein